MAVPKKKQSKKKNNIQHNSIVCILKRNGGFKYNIVFNFKKFNY